MYYNNYQQQQTAEMTGAVKHANIQECFDDLLTKLSLHEHWHMKMANQNRKTGYRGHGRWHDYCACYINKFIVCFGKLLIDRLKYIPNIQYSTPAGTIETAADFNGQHALWAGMKNDVIGILNECITEMRSIDACIYDKLFCFLHKTQDDKIKLELYLKRMANGGGEPHDVMICEMVIHKYFECEHKDGDDINFNLG